MPVRTRIDVPLTEEFDVLGYDTYATYQDITNDTVLGRQSSGALSNNFSLAGQQHIDVRTFSDPTLAGFTPENWTVSPNSVAMTLGANASLNHWPALQTLVSPGLNTFTSVAAPVNISQLGNAAALTLVLPGLTGTNVNFSSSYLDISDGTNTYSIAFSAASQALGGSVGSSMPLLLAPGVGSSAIDELSVPISSITGVNLEAITTVALRVQALASFTFVALALRVLASTWVVTNVDFDNWNGLYRQPVPPSGFTSYFPVASNLTIPPMWKTSATGSTDDPTPINASMAVVFYTGAATATNTFTMNMRQIGGVDTSQLILDSITQAQLSGPQPGIIDTAELPREISDFTGLPMATLSGQHMTDLEAVQAHVTESGVQFTVQWGVAPYAQISNSVNPIAGYTWGSGSFPTLSVNTYYEAIFTLIDNQARIQLYSLNQADFSLEIAFATTTKALPVGTAITSIPGVVTTTIPSGLIEVAFETHSQIFTTTGAAVGNTSIPVASEVPTYAFPIGSSVNVPAVMPTPLFDSGLISDSYQFERRPGRIGWQAQLNDGNAAIRSIRPQSLIFAEYQSSILASNTPVKGARLYVQSTPDTEMWTEFSATSGGGVTPTITMDSVRQLTGSSYKVAIGQASVGQGLLSNVLTPSYDVLSGIVDFAHAEIHLSLWFPSAALGSGSAIFAYLIGQDGYIVPLSMPRISPDNWDAIVLYPPANLPSGRYQLGLTYVGNASATFWVDAVSVFERAITWSARANPNDPWTDFRDLINTDTGGVTFPSPGSSLQVRAQAHQQAASIFSSPQLVPVYAELGAFAWPENAPVDPFPTSNSAATIQATGATVHPATLQFAVTTYSGQITSPLTPSMGAVTFIPLQLYSLGGQTLPATTVIVYNTAGAYQAWTGTAAESANFVGNWPVVSQTPSATFPSGSYFSLMAPSWAITSYQWSFGDGGSASGPVTSHTFQTAGTYNVTLTMVDTYGARSIVNSLVTIT